jgi:hypothetical protein
MGTSLNGLTPSATYQGLVKFGDNSVIGASLKYLSDGQGNDLPISVASTGVGINTITNSALLSIQGTGNTNATSSINVFNSVGTSIFQARNDGYIFVPNFTAQYNVNSMNGSFSSQVNIGSPTVSGQKLGVRGSGSTSATTSLIVQNSLGNSVLTCTDDGKVYVQSNSFTVSGYSARINNLQLGLIGSKVISATGGDSSINIDAGGIGISGATALTPTARLHVKGNGSTSATTSFLVQDSAGLNAFYVRDDRFAWFSKEVTVGGSSSASITMGTGGSNNPYINAFGNGLELTTSGSYGASSNIQFRPQANWSVVSTTSGTGVFAINTDGNNERLRVTQAGNVGIGTTTPNLLGVSKELTLESKSATNQVAMNLSGYATTSGTIGSFLQFYNNGNRVAYIGSARGSVDNSSDLIFATANAGTLAQNMVISSAGNVGIGRTSPATKLDVNGIIKVAGNGGGYVEGYRVIWETPDTHRGIGANSFQIANVTSQGMTFGCSNNQFAVLNSSGNFGIGTLSPTSRLQVQGSGTTSATSNLLLQNSSATQLVKVTDDGKMTMGTGTTGTALLDISVGAGSTPPLRLKGYSDAGTSYLISAGTESFADNFKVKMVNGNVTMGTQLNGYTFGLETFNGVAMHIANAGNIGMGTTSPNVSAKLDVNSTTQGFLPPVMTTAQKTAITTPAAGLVVYDSTTNKLCCYNGSTWNDLF